MTSSTGATQTYPMRYGGGAFVCGVGIAIIIGALMGGDAIAPALGIGFLLGTLAIFVLRARVARLFGRPERRQVRLMWGAIAFELAGFALLSWCISSHVISERELWPGVLAVVAAHFVLMRWSFGGWMAYLGIAILLWLGLAWLMSLSLTLTLVGDGFLKLGFGAIMAAPLFLRPKNSATN